MEQKELSEIISKCEREAYQAGIRRAREVVEERRKPKSYWSHPWWREEEIAYNEAIDDLLTALDAELHGKK